MNKRMLRITRRLDALWLQADGDDELRSSLSKVKRTLVALTSGHATREMLSATTSELFALRARLVDAGLVHGSADELAELRVEFAEIGFAL